VPAVGGSQDGPGGTALGRSPAGEDDGGAALGEADGVVQQIGVVEGGDEGVRAVGSGEGAGEPGGCAG